MPNTDISSFIEGSLIGSLLPRVLLKKRGVAKEAMTFADTETGKPYCVGRCIQLKYSHLRLILYPDHS